MNRLSKNEKGFTLVEIIVALIIGAFVALVAIGTLRVVSLNAATVDNTIESRGNIRFAAETIKKDLINLHRGSRQQTKLIGIFKEMDSRVTFTLCIYTVSRTKARISQPEGDVYEVEYFLKNYDEKSILIRRLWPYPDEESEPGGVLTEMAEGIDVLEIKFFDGENWVEEWTEDMQTLPELVEVVVGTWQGTGKDFISETFIVNYSKDTGQTAGELTSEEGDEEQGESESTGDTEQENNI